MKFPSPIDDAKNRLWKWMKDNKLGRVVAIVLIALTILGWIAEQFDVIDKLRSRLTRARTYATPDEITCLNEWVLRLAQSDTKENASSIKDAFLNDYLVFGHVNSGGEPIWKNDVHIVRDIKYPGKWLVVIDMYPGASSERCMEEGKAEMVEILDGKPDSLQPGNRRDWENRIGRILRPSVSLCYDFAEFEQANGKIANDTQDVEYQRRLGSCVVKLKRAPDKKCSDSQ